MAATPSGQLSLLAEYPKVRGRTDALVAERRLKHKNSNARSKRKVIETLMLPILAERWRYAHVTTLRGDWVDPPL